jgi:hypothetical protein
MATINAAKPIRLAVQVIDRAKLKYNIAKTGDEMPQLD